MSPAPIAVFAYRRPVHLTRTIESLMGNPEARDSKLFIFCDGPKRPEDAEAVAATRRVAERAPHPAVTLIRRESNMGLARSVIDGVTWMCAQFDRLIVLEDDLLLSPTYLSFMNSALDRYATTERAFHVSGFMYPVTLDASFAEAFFLPFINTSGGWATWARAWKHFDATCAAAPSVLDDRSVMRRFDLDGAYPFSRILRDHLAGRVDSWAIRWYLSVFRARGLGLFPCMSLAQNIGFGDDATHTTMRDAPPLLRSRAHALRAERFPPVSVDERAFADVTRFLRRDRGLVRRVARRIKSAVPWRR